jgi:hypothetical protein
VNRSLRKRDQALGGWLATSELMERLIEVRKRKRIFDGQTVDMEALSRWPTAQQREKRDR